MVTAFLLRLAEVSHWFSLLTVLAGFLVTLGVLLRFFRDDLRPGGGALTRLDSCPAPRMAVSRAPLPLSASLAASPGGGGGGDRCGPDAVEVSLASRPPFRISVVRVRLFAGVSVAALHHALRGPWEWFLDAFLRGGNPFGRDGCRQAGEMVQVELPESESSKVVRLERPRPEEPPGLGGTPRRVYPFVVVCVPRDEDILSDANEGKVGAVLSVIHVRDEQCPVPTQVLFTHLKHCEGSRSTTLTPIFVSGADEYEDSSAEEGEERDDRTSARSQKCVVCQDLPVTRVIFPCRHACVCRRCFGRLGNRCPMCRTYVQSFFLLDQEEESEEEEEVASAASRTRKTWGQWLEEMNHNFALRMGLQENH